MMTNSELRDCIKMTSDLLSLNPHPHQYKLLSYFFEKLIEEQESRIAEGKKEDDCGFAPSIGYLWNGNAPVLTNLMRFLYDIHLSGVIPESIDLGYVDWNFTNHVDELINGNPSFESNCMREYLSRDSKGQKDKWCRMFYYNSVFGKTAVNYKIKKQ